MIRLPLSKFESAARELVEIHERDPDMLSFYGDLGGKKRPLWVNFAEALRAHYERDIALEKAGL